MTRRARIHSDDGDDYVESEVEYKAKTAKAILVAFRSHREEWVPRSLLHYSSDREVERLKRGEKVTIIVREWYAHQIGLEY